MKKLRNILLTIIVFVFAITIASIASSPSVYADTLMSLQYTTHVQNIGWQGNKTQDSISGTTGQSLRVEGIKIYLDNPMSGVKLKYKAHVENVGWQGWSENGILAGTTGQGLQLEALRVILEGAPSDYHVYYQAYIQNIGWQDYVKDGNIAGTTGRGLRLEAIRIKIVKDNPTNLNINYQAHVQNIGWQQPVVDGNLSGTTGQALSMEALRINVVNPIPGMQVLYEAHVQNIGWQDWVTSGKDAGTTGKGLSLEALKIKLQGVPSYYHVQYQAHVQNLGWQPWVEDGEIAGTVGKGLKIEGIRIKILNSEYSNTRTVEAVNLNNTLLAKAVLQTSLQLESAKSYLEPDNFRSADKMYQFLRIDRYYDGVYAGDLSTYLDNLSGVGTHTNVFNGQAKAFMESAKQYNIDVVYFVSHAMWESGYGTSALAQGINVSSVNGKNVTPRITYNFFGIGAYDSGAQVFGSQAAYANGWFTPELAIRGAAKWISENYIHGSYSQYNIYTMKWGNSTNNWHQYATDPNWAGGVSSLMNRFSYFYRNSNLLFSVPHYN